MHVVLKFWRLSQAKRMKRTTATIALDERTIVVDVLKGSPYDNPWYVCVDEVLPDGDLEPLAGAHCDAPLDQCNGDTLLNYWIDFVYHAEAT